MNRVSYKNIFCGISESVECSEEINLNIPSGGAIRALMMGIHAYFNIWCEARAGWAVFMKRRSAVHKISSLPEANYNQLVTLDDVCAICYQVRTLSRKNWRINF